MTQQDKPPYADLKTKQAAINTQALTQAISRLLDTPVLSVTYENKQLQGGTLGDVQLLTGSAQTTDGRSLPFTIVQKTQAKWERPGDPLSWRREYDLYRSEFHTLFTNRFASPRLYHAQESESENQLWMEALVGTSGAELTLDQLALAAEELGRFQGRCHRQETTLQQIACLSDAGAMQRDFAQWTPDTVEYQYLRSKACALPPQLRQMLLDLQAQSDALFTRMQSLPQVLCHRDYWTENIFVSGSNVRVIDWDCAGWGVPGEDIASLIADETPAARIGEYYRRLLPAYYAGLADNVTLPPMDALPIREMILLKFGYRLVQQLMFSQTQEPKDEAVQALDAIRTLD